MAVDIALINGCSVQRTIANIAQAKGLSIGYFDILDISRESFSLELKTNSTVLMHVLSESEWCLRFFTELRLNKDFRGTGGILSFLPITQFLELSRHQLLDTEGFFFLHLPFAISKLFGLLEKRAPLSDCSMTAFRKTLGASTIAQEAGLLKHDVGNKLGLALAHFRTLEKLSYFDNPKLDEVLKQVRHLSLCLTNEKVKDIRRDVTQLFARAETFGVQNESRDLAVSDECWTSLEEWSSLIEQTRCEVSPASTEIFKQSKQAQLSIKTILETISNLREAAQQAINDVQQNPSSR